MVFLTGEKMQEKRKLERRNFIYDIEVSDRGKPVDENGEFPVLGDLADVTVEGVMLVSDEPVAEKTAFQLRVVLPDDVEGMNILDFEAESIRCSGTVHESIYTTGFRITEIDDATQKAIVKLIDEYAV